MEFSSTKRRIGDDRDRVTGARGHRLSSRHGEQYGENAMGKFLIEASYTAEGLHGLRKEKAASRRAVVTRMVKELGGKVEAFYWSFGDRDAIVVLDLPDAATASALAFTVSSTGMVRTKTTSLFTAEEVDKAFKKTVRYHAPGK